MERDDDLWRRTTAQAVGFVRRRRDPWTQSHRDDLVQDATVAAWQWSQRPHDPARFWAAVRTIVQRVRVRSLRLSLRQRAAWQAAAESTASGEATETCFQIAGRRVPEHRARPLLDRALARLTELDRRLLLGLYEGFCCAELALRFRRSEPCVKTRIHRARQRVQRAVEASVRAADDLEA